METFQVSRYRCDICKTVYDSAEAAEKCESRPISQDKGVNVGDKVRITTGDGSGDIATVENVSVLSREWGPRMAIGC